MFQGNEIPDDTYTLWQNFLLKSRYVELLTKINKQYKPYEYLIDQYSEKRRVNISLLNMEDENIDKKINENILLLKNALELYKSARNSTDFTSPILYHYSWHFLNAFFFYTFFKWEKEHSGGHGINVTEWDEDLIGFEITIRGNGVYQRLIDCFSLLGMYNVFSKYMLVKTESDIKFIKNEYEIKNKITIEELINADYYSDLREFLKTSKRVKTPYNSDINTNVLLLQYLNVFIISNIARYRPLILDSILEGESEIKSEFALRIRSSLSSYTELTFHKYLEILQSFHDERFTFTGV